MRLYLWKLNRTGCSFLCLIDTCCTFHNGIPFIFPKYVFLRSTNWVLLDPFWNRTFVTIPAGTGRQYNVRLTLHFCWEWKSDWRQYLKYNVRLTLHFCWEWKSDWRQYLTPIWCWLNIGFWLHNLKTTNINISWRQYWTSNSIDIRSWIDIEFWSPDAATEI